MDQFVVEAASVDRESQLGLHMVEFFPFLAEHDGLVVRLPREHLFHLDHLDRVLKTLVVIFDLCLELHQDLFDVRQQHRQVLLALLAALLAPLLQIVLL